jgi:hypothetical protein
MYLAKVAENRHETKRRDDAKRTGLDIMPEEGGYLSERSGHRTAETARQKAPFFVRNGPVNIKNK